MVSIPEPIGSSLLPNLNLPLHFHIIKQTSFVSQDFRA